MADAEDIIDVTPDDAQITAAQQLRVDAFTQIVHLAIGERGPECMKWEDLKLWASDTAAWMQTGEWPTRNQPKLKKIDGGRDASKAPGGQ